MRNKYTILWGQELLLHRIISSAAERLKELMLMQPNPRFSTYNAERRVKSIFFIQFHVFVSLWRLLDVTSTAPFNKYAGAISLPR